MLTCQQVWEEHGFIFEFDKAYNHQLIEKFEASPLLALTEKVAPPETGVYALYWKGEMVYAGKALKTTLKRRLAEHTQRISCRLSAAFQGLMGVGLWERPKTSPLSARCAMDFSDVTSPFPCLRTRSSMSSQTN